MQVLAGVGAAGFDISGGQETVTVGGFKYVVFTSSGTLTVSGGHSVMYFTAPTTIVYELILDDFVYGIIAPSTNVLG